jgi:acetate CoA/acetoacetate CoA-transferase beta subunit
MARRNKGLRMDIKNLIAKRAAQELKDGQVVSLGIGIPTLIANYVPLGVDVVIQSPNGAINVGPVPGPFCDDVDRANAGGEPITLKGGGSFFDSVASYAMIRGGHIDVTFLGAFQVDTDGSIANYEIPGRCVIGMGGAMDLLVGARVVNVVTEHCSKRGEPKLVRKCTFPVTGAGRADLIITERAVFRHYLDKGFVLEEVAQGYSLDDIADCTQMDYSVAENVKLDAY